MINIICNIIRATKKGVRKIIVLCNSFYIYCSLKRNKNILKKNIISRILVIQLYDIGDTILSTPFFRELRSNLPEAKITLLVNEKTYNLVELNPYVDKIIICDFFGRGKRKIDMKKYVMWARKHLWGKKYDRVIALSWAVDFRLSLISHLIFKPFGLISNAYILFRRKSLLKYLFRISPRYRQIPDHEVTHNLELIKLMGGRIEKVDLELQTNEEDQAYAQTCISGYGIKMRDFVVAFCPGAYWPNHRWPIHNYVQLAKWLNERYLNLKIIVIGSKEEKQLGEILRDALPGKTLNLSGSASLRQTLAILQKCRLYIGNDTGGAHLSAAAGIPVISITCHPKRSGTNNNYDIEKYPFRYAPWQIPHIMIQPEAGKSPCVDFCRMFNIEHCIANIKLEDVKRTVSKFITTHSPEGINH